MAIETVYASSHLAGDFVNPNNALGTQDSVWAGELNTATNRTSRWAIANPTNNALTPGQTHWVEVRARKGSNSGNPTIQLNLYQNGTLVQALGASFTVSSTTGVVFQRSFLSSAITDPSGIEIEVVMTAASGGPSARNSAQIDYIRVDIDTTPPAAPTLDQSAYRFRNDDGSQTGATWKAAVNTAVTVARGQQFRLRFGIVNSGTGGATTDWQLWYRRNAGGWSVVEAAGTADQPVLAALSSQVTEGEATTQQITSGTFTAGAVGEDDGYLNSFTLASGARTELEFSLITNTNTSFLQDGDTLEFRLTRGNWTVLDQYTVIPMMTMGASPDKVAVDSAALTEVGTLKKQAPLVNLTDIVPENFESFTVDQPWAQGSTQGKWLVEWTGPSGSFVGAVSDGVDKALRLFSPETTGDPQWGDTGSSLAVSKDRISGDFDIEIDMRTTAQSRSVSPNGWEVGWFGWHYQRLSTNPSIVRFYYLILKPNTGGFELGKVDQSIAFPGGQRFLPTLNVGTLWPVGTTWKTVRVRQTGSRIEVWVDGVKQADFTDGPGSGGTPAWGDTVGETVFTEGQLVFYQEDSTAEFDNLQQTTDDFPAADSGVLTEQASAGIGSSATDSSALTESASMTAQASATDAFSFSESAVVEVLVNASDQATLAESAQQSSSSNQIEVSLLSTDNSDGDGGCVLDASTAVEGDGLIAKITHDGAVPSTPSGWLLRGTEPGSFGHSLSVYTKTAAASETSYTFTHAGWSGGVLVGVHKDGASIDFDFLATDSVGDAQTSFAAPGGTMSADGVIISTWVQVENGATITKPAAMTSLHAGDLFRSQATAYELVGSGSTGSRTATSTANATWLASTVGMKESTGGAVDKPATDSATLTESAVVQVAQAAVDSGSMSDQAISEGSLNSVDAASLNESAIIGLESFENFLMLDGSLLAAMLDAIDSAVLSEGTVADRQHSAQDSAALSEAATGGETGSTQVASDAASLTEIAQTSASAGAEDAGALSETALVGSSVTSTEAFTFSESASVEVLLSATDGAVLGESMSSGADTSASDQALMDELAQMTALLAGVDSASLSESAEKGDLGEPNKAGSDGFVMSEAASVDAGLSGTDTFSMAEQAVVEVSWVGTDTASAGEAAGTSAVVQAAEVFTVTEVSQADTGGGGFVTETHVLTDQALLQASTPGQDQFLFSEQAKVDIQRFTGDSASLTDQAAPGQDHASQVVAVLSDFAEVTTEVGNTDFHGLVEIVDLFGSSSISDLGGSATMGE